jgi:uncharacterized protein (TIGR02145 family)
MRDKALILIFPLLFTGLFFLFSSCKKETDEDIIETHFTDPRDGTVYKMVKIGSQVWMAENLAYLPSVVGSDSGSQTTPCYYVYGYDGTNVSEAKATSNFSTYGVLYNWSAAMDGSASNGSGSGFVQGVCPPDWHLPSDAEWKQLEMYLEMSQTQADNKGWRGSDQGSYLKEEGTTHWMSHYKNDATNSSGFTALPGGFRFDNGLFNNIRRNGRWWTATEDNAALAYYRGISFDNSTVFRGVLNKELGHSVRCIQDNFFIDE